MEKLGSLTGSWGLDKVCAQLNASSGLAYPHVDSLNGGKKRRGFMLEMPPMRMSLSSISPATITSLPAINQGPLGKWGASGHPSQAVIV